MPYEPRVQSLNTAAEPRYQKQSLMPFQTPTMKDPNHNSSLPSPFLPPNPNMFMIIPPNEPVGKAKKEQVSNLGTVSQRNLDLDDHVGKKDLPPGGYILPLFSTRGPQEHHWLSGTESRTEAMCDPQPIQVLPSVNDFRQKSHVHFSNNCPSCEHRYDTGDTSVVAANRALQSGQERCSE